jgi:ADP-ribosylglycohydrolase
MKPPDDYAERVYAGVLGKLIGVYLGRPFEQWTHARIEERLGEIHGYVASELPLVLTDDDLSGTFTFARAAAEHGPDVTPAQFGDGWLNYVVEGRSTFWWGGAGVSSEHTAYLHLKDGMRAPASGSAAVNGKVLSEQIGAQIFVDALAMTCPGDPGRAADLARRSASVSHDGEAVYAAQVIASMEALAFVERDIGALLDGALAQIPAESVIARLIGDLRGWHADEPDWRRARDRIQAEYGYDRYRGACHVVPNHALVVLGLLYGAGDFDRSMTIVNTAGWDTDCNAGNLGCLLGIRNGLAGIADRWREPVRDRLYISSADGGRAITDAATEALRIAGSAPAARFHFPFPGSVQGFEGGRHEDGALAVDGTAVTPTFIPPEAIGMGGYELQASPTLYPGQTIRAAITGAPARLLVRVYGGDDALETIAGPPGAVEWRVPDTGGRPVAQVGIETQGAARLEWLTWDGAPEVTFTRPPDGGTMWRRAWVRAVDRFEPDWREPFRLIQDRGRGLLIQGTAEWTDYTVRAPVVPETVVAAGIAARVQGLRRYLALLLEEDRARLVRRLDAHEETIAEAPVRRRDYGPAHALGLAVQGERVRGVVDGETVLEGRDDALGHGAVALVCEQGCLTCDAVTVGPAG